MTLLLKLTVMMSPTTSRTQTTRPVVTAAPPRTTKKTWRMSQSYLPRSPHTHPPTHPPHHSLPTYRLRVRPKASSPQRLHTSHPHSNHLPNTRSLPHNSSPKSRSK
ncbi:hypothetical protein C8Q74DRAFT_1231365 [Fomes fomentarius]|nr:hypothetical protein C8Q74DRAFT_1231365 [Fomes fomentarius]